MKIISFVFLSFFIISCTSDSKKSNYKEIAQTSNKYIDGYTGDATCIECHKTEYDLWKGSHHDLAMQIANEAT
ncbi:MAG: hypothetical protein IMY67_04365, partial [Bacteroidetes bacterium]|nr:hypothetical protein [Bacteroidota bacterium]